MIEVYKLLTGKEQVDHKQFLTLADMHDLRGHEKKLTKGRSRLDSRKFFFSQKDLEWSMDGMVSRQKL